MSQFTTDQQQVYYDEPYVAPRTSLLCTVGFGSSLILCCPLTSLLGLLLGISGLISVSASNGMRRGRGFGFAAVIIALLGLTAQGLLTWYGWPWFQDYVAAAMELSRGPVSFMQAASDNDLTAARAALYPTAATAATDQDITQFITEAEKRYGRIQSWIPPVGTSLQIQKVPGVYPTTAQGNAEFDNGDWSVTILYTVELDASQRLPKRGIEAIIIRDSTNGDLVFDPAGVLSASQKRQPDTQNQPPSPDTDTDTDNGGG